MWLLCAPSPRPPCAHPRGEGGPPQASSLLPQCLRVQIQSKNARIEHLQTFAAPDSNYIFVVLIWKYETPVQLYY
jgi:hypothetical protein